jgi:hypothetical protein
LLIENTHKNSTNVCERNIAENVRESAQVDENERGRERRYTARESAKVDENERGERAPANVDESERREREREEKL